MPELTLAQTGCIAGGLILSLILPFMMTGKEFQNTDGKKACLKTVWSGQLILAACGLLILFWPAVYLYAAGFAIVSCALCARLLLQKLSRAELR